MDKKNLCFIALFSFVALILVGCSTRIMLTSKPEGANIIIGKTNISGTTPMSSSIRRTTFGKYWFSVEKPGYEPLYGLLPLNVSGAAITINVLLFAPATFWNAQRAFPFYQFDLEKRIVGYKKDSDDPWREYPIKEQERLTARSFFGSPKRENTTAGRPQPEQAEAVEYPISSTGSRNDVTAAQRPGSSKPLNSEREQPPARADKTETTTPSGAGVVSVSLVAPAQSAKDNKTEALEWFGKAQKFRQSGDFQNAVEAFSKAIQLNPIVVAFYTERGLAYRSLSQNQKAVNDFSIALDLEPNNADALWQRSQAFAKMGELQKALTDIKAAARLGQKDASEFMKANGIESDN